MGFFYFRGLLWFHSCTDWERQRRCNPCRRSWNVSDNFCWISLSVTSLKSLDLKGRTGIGKEIVYSSCWPVLSDNSVWQLQNPQLLWPRSSSTYSHKNPLLHPNLISFWAGWEYLSISSVLETLFPKNDVSSNEKVIDCFPGRDSDKEVESNKLTTRVYDVLQFRVVVSLASCSSLLE